ncbi:MAG: hypothetical protein B7Z47_06115, partial [Chthoniobacter sp. 12-60-6]
VAVSSNANLVVGQTVTGAGVPAGTTVTSIAGNNITLSNSVTAGSVALTFSTVQSNTYTGPTVVNQGTLTLAGQAGSIVIPGDLTLNNAVVTMTLNAGQIAAGSNITINSGSTLTYLGNNTLSGLLAFNNPGGPTAPILAAGFGVLTLGNDITASNDSFTLPAVISATAAAGTTAAPTTGVVNLGGAARSITTSGLALVSLDITAALQGTGASGITKAGNGGLRLTSAGNSYAGATTLSGGTIFLGASNVLPDFSTFSMLAGSTLDLNGFSDVISQLSGAGSITNNSGTAGTLTAGLNNADTTFSGQFLGYTAATLATLNVAKVGTGNLTLTGSGSTATGTLTINGGTVTLSGSGQTAFGTYAVNTGGLLVLDNSTTAGNNRLGGPNATSASNSRNVTLAGGEFKIIGAATGTTYESLGIFTNSNGANKLTVDASGGASTIVNFASVAAIGGATGSHTVVRGTNLGAAPGAGVANVFTSAIAQQGGANVSGLANVSVRADMLADTSLTGNGVSFATYFPGTGFRVLTANETLATTTGMNTSTANLKVAGGSQTFTTNTMNTITLDSGGGLTGFNVGSVMTVGGVAILALPGNTGLSGGQISGGASNTWIHAVGDLVISS